MQLAKLKYFLGGILSLAVLAGALRVIPLGGESLVGDELFSRYVAMASFGDATRVAMQDIVHPPLYYFALGL